MTKAPTIFVQIASYRDPELLPTLKDMVKHAANPEKLCFGICEQYGDEGPVALKEVGLPEAQIQRLAVPYQESKGVCWARSELQKFYADEDYTLAIDSHMRFVKNWDKKLLGQHKKCPKGKIVITGHPGGYTPPDSLQKDATPTILEALPPNASGDIRLRGTVTLAGGKKPVKGIFVAPGFWFARGEIIREVPYDPYLYFEQEEMCLSARFYTHGWDIYHPMEVLAYHLYTATPVPFERHMHWDDHADWSNLNRRAMARRDHVLGRDLSEDENIIQELDRYGHGDARGLEGFLSASGIDMPDEVTEEVVENGDRSQAAPQPAKKTGLRDIPSFRGHISVEKFKPASLNVLGGVPKGANGKVAAAEKAEIMDAPPGVLIIRNYASKSLCKQLVDYADKVAGTKLNVVDSDRSTRDNIKTQASDGRITDHVNINGALETILSTFLDIYANRLTPFYGETFEWFERPQILRYSAGGKYDPHADADHYFADKGEWFRSQDRDISVLLYLNEDYGGGEIAFPNLDWEIKPERGMLLAFPSDHRYLHAAKPTTSGMRYVIVSWSAVHGSPRALATAPYASVVMNIP